MSEHVVPVRTYAMVFGTLLILTGVTTGVAYIDLGPFNTVVALAIAVCKMLVVVLFFMHAKYLPGLTKIVVVAGFFWRAILITFTLSDEFSRGWTPFSSQWQPAIRALPKDK